MKKIILSIVLLASVAFGDRLLIPTISKHGSSSNLVGEEYNEIHHGIGYEYLIKDNDNYNLTFTSMAMSDSYKNSMIGFTLGADYKLFSFFSLGLDAGVASKEVKIYNRGRSRLKRMVTPVLSPSVTFTYHKLSATIFYTPKIYTGRYRIDSVALLVMGWEL